MFVSKIGITPGKSVKIRLIGYIRVPIMVAREYERRQRPGNAEVNGERKSPYAEVGYDAQKAVVFIQEHPQPQAQNVRAGCPDVAEGCPNSSSPPVRKAAKK